MSFIVGFPIFAIVISFVSFFISVAVMSSRKKKGIMIGMNLAKAYIFSGAVITSSVWFLLVYYLWG